MRATCSGYVILIDLIILIKLGEESKSWSSSLCSVFQPLSLHPSSGPNILVSTLFSDTTSLSSPVSNTKFHTHKKSTLLDIPIFTFLDSKREDKKVLDWMVTNIAWIQSLLNLFPVQIWSVTGSPKYFKISALSKDLLALFMLRFCPAFWWRENNIYLVFHAFVCSLTSVLASIKVSVFFLMVSMLSPSRFTWQHWPGVNVSHLIPFSPSFPGSS
jgi:hypothetical protein